ncbi:hypothetical protein IW140_006172 [Coemansia sp. RSA 1813]|nr:hypothetical protein EV178_003921 [Coemansia sp. RSA 1646]KAJ1766571.1 hypothetical protein LPJ74_005816 [Coemansia sp. RSA 1843]KAJ2085712.1 hypothetical protein IW138_006157 [Coemansia sp. RSA 986]KAJ2210603.1 hypothetical protein EV179_006127 [Coemansia sp. RSA 487]KAJ2563280.1 hypothetical protein IW140_006172 [Coemansia sp. RSA 1813]
MDTLIRNNEKLAKHQAGASQKVLSAVDAALKALQTARQQLSIEEESPADLEKALAQLERSQATSSEQLKELYTNVSKYGKLVDKTFKLDLSTVAESRAFEDKRDVLAQAILLHFLREGDFVTASRFAIEAQLQLPEDTKTQFEDMYCTVAEMRGAEHELSSAIAWTVANREKLEELELPLEFALHRLRFLQLVERGRGAEALMYSRTWFPRFASQLGEIEHLMGIFIYAKRLESSPYASLFTEQRWEDGAHAFASAFCTLMGLAAASPLSVTVAAGARALPVVCKVSGLLRDKKVEWSQQNELPVEVPLPDEMRFHSVFACPVSKEQATRENPPMMMPCGHVVCKASLDKLARGVRPGSIASGRFKCPYCPGLSVLSDARRVYF